MKLVLPDHSIKEVKDNISGLEACKTISISLAKAAICVKVDDKLQDLAEPITHDCNFEVITKSSPEAMEVLRHSAAHLLAEAVKHLYPDAMFAYGPATEEGFFYIRDEYDEEEQDIKKLSEDVYELEGGTLISDINEELHMHITSECDTLSGYMIELLDYIPKSKNLPINVSDKEADYVICAMEDRVISKVKLTKKPEEPEPDNDEELL